MPGQKPLPSAELLRLADEMLAAREAVLCLSQTAKHEEISRIHTAERTAREAYRAARAASPVTLEERLLIEAFRAQGGTERVQAKAAEDALNHARALAKKGGPDE